MNAKSVSTWSSSQAIRPAVTLLAALAFLFFQPSNHRPVLAAPAKPVPAATCATCHAGIAASYSHAPMRHAIEPAGQNPVLNSHPDLQTQLDGYSYSVKTRDGQSTYTVSDGKDSITLPIRWIFGQKSQTWVLEKDGVYYESQVSYFPQEQALFTTPGHANYTPHTLTEAIGQKTSRWVLIQCFNCHATNSVHGTQLTLDTLRPGLDCERCHIGAAQHMADAAQDNYKSLPLSLHKMDAGQAANFCGQCHRTWDATVRNHWHGAADVRFQPYRLENSKCFNALDPRISCLACHNPHQPVNHDTASYDPKCLACHSGAKSSSTNSHTSKTCPVAKSNCASCHMPKTELPAGHALFTDHQIRVVHPGDPYPN